MHIRLKKTILKDYVEELSNLAEQIKTHIKLDRDLEIENSDDLMMLNILIILSKKIESNEMKPCLKKHFENLYIKGLSNVYITSEELDVQFLESGEIYIQEVEQNISKLNFLGMALLEDFTLKEYEEI